MTDCRELDLPRRTAGPAAGAPCLHGALTWAEPERWLVSSASRHGDGAHHCSRHHIAASSHAGSAACEELQIDTAAQQPALAISRQSGRQQALCTTSAAQLGWAKAAPAWLSAAACRWSPHGVRPGAAACNGTTAASQVQLSCFLCSLVHAAHLTKGPCRLFVPGRTRSAGAHAAHTGARLKAVILHEK